MLKTSYTEQNTLEINTPVLLLKLHSTWYISVIETQNLCYLHQYKIIINDKVGWYNLHIIFQNSV